MLGINGEREQGEDVRSQNVTAAMAVANVVKTSFGPVGLDKMLVNDVGDVLVTNDGATILQQLDIKHAAAKVLVELATLQEWNEMPKYAQRSKAFVREKILERIPEETLKHQITELLFERDYEELLAQIREVQKTTRPRRRNMSEQRRTIKAVRKKRSAAKKRAGS